MRFNRFVPSLSAATPIPNHKLRIFLSFVLFYVFLTLCARTRSFRDPGSVFFDPSTAYDLSYSAVRLEQADQYVDSAVSDTKPKKSGSSHQPGLCLGIPTIARKGVRYFKHTVGTLLEGLDETERADIHLILFIAHTDPSQHPAYAEPWLHELADQVLLRRSILGIYKHWKQTRRRRQGSKRLCLTTDIFSKHVRLLIHRISSCLKTMWSL